MILKACPLCKFKLGTKGLEAYRVRTSVAEAEVINMHENDSGTLRIFHSKMLFVKEDMIIAGV